MKEKSPPVLLSEFIKAIDRAAQAAWQIVHTHQDPRFLPIRDRLEIVKQKCLKIAVRHTHQSNDPGNPNAIIIRNK